MGAQVEFDEEGLVARVSRAAAGVLRRMGAYVRTAARRRVATSPDPSRPGTPPHTRGGALRRGILFAVEQRRFRVLVGPSFRFVGESMAAHEFGGGYRRERYPKRPLMGPALRDSIPHLARMWENAVN